MPNETYRVVQVTAPGTFQIVERKVREPSPGHVRIRVEACGICHTDAVSIEGHILDAAYPHVPGHEIVGRIDALGEGVLSWELGQRVGVGFLGGHCGQCESCRRGDFVHCVDQPRPGTTSDGGYAEVVLARASGLVAIPDELHSVAAAPLLCAGLTTFNALRQAVPSPGSLVGVQGIGGLGHLGVQQARKMGLRVAAIARGPEKAEFAKRLGAHYYIDSLATDPAAELQSLGGAQVVLATASIGNSTSQLVGGLADGGRLVVLGVSPEPLQLDTYALISGGYSVQGSLTGSAIENEDNLAFSVLQNIRPMTETFPLEKAADAYAHMMSGQARFRAVLSVGA